ncbi:hypothetical protein [Saccharothrix sp. HUAS TT1]|uniref:hypothetical protein n=1 Tax=unclassified Saccharothrix TaxID=2593673 RepID=UPI00345C0187
MTCVNRRAVVTSEAANLRRLARMAARNETRRNVELVIAAKAKVEDAKSVLTQHEAYCEVAA